MPTEPPRPPTTTSAPTTTADTTTDLRTCPTVLATASCPHCRTTQRHLPRRSRRVCGYGAPMSLDLHADPADLTAALVDIPSVSGTEGPIADADRGGAARAGRGSRWSGSGNAVLARTRLGRPTRVLLAGHIDTVPIADNVPSRLDGDTLHGCGTTDMKSGDAMLLHLAATLAEPSRDLTFIFYDCEEIEYDRNGLTRIQAEHPRLAGRRPGDPRRADQRPGRGRLPGHRSAR